MKKILLLIAALALSSYAGAQNLDGNWYDSPSYGADGDTVITEVKASIKEMAAAEAALEADRSIENLQSAIDASLFSWLKAEHELEIGDINRANGDAIAAKAAYAKATEYANAAVAMKDNGLKAGNGTNAAEKSHKKGSAVLKELAKAKRQ